MLLAATKQNLYKISCRLVSREVSYAHKDIRIIGYYINDQMLSAKCNVNFFGQNNATLIWFC